MLSVAVFYLVAVICSARWTHALPLYPDTNMEPQEEFIQKLMSEVEDGSDAAEANKLYRLLPQHSDGTDPWNKGIKDSVPQEKFANTVEELREAVLKLAAAEKLRSQGFLRSEQNLPKTNKRACFWKYCVTS